MVVQESNPLVLGASDSCYSSSLSPSWWSLVDDQTISHPPHPVFFPAQPPPAPYITFGVFHLVREKTTIVMFKCGALDKRHGE
jgi:hypothetical protein